MAELNRRLETFPDTLYLSFVAERPLGVLGQSLGRLSLFAPVQATLLFVRALICIVGDVLAHSAMLHSVTRGQGTSFTSLPMCDVSCIPSPDLDDERAAPGGGAGGEGKTGWAQRGTAICRQPSDGLLRCATQEGPAGVQVTALRLPQTTLATPLAQGVNELASAAEMRQLAALCRRLHATGHAIGGQLLSPGIWHASKLTACDHVGVVPFPVCADMPVAFFHLLLALVETSPVFVHVRTGGSSKRGVAHRHQQEVSHSPPPPPTPEALCAITLQPTKLPEPGK